MKNKDKNTSVIGTVFNVQHFCVDDGPGIRTTVFLKGCPLRCAWCHNPESHRSEREIMLRSDRCILCGMCFNACKNGAHTVSAENGTHFIDRQKCISCGECIEACPAGALEAMGESKTVEEIIKEILSDRVFYETSGGGVTVSGGEPTSQPEFTEALLSECKREGLHTCIESCLWCGGDTVLKLLPLTDIFLVDWKITDDELHRRYTGVSNARITENLGILNENGARAVLRCPLIPSVNMNRSHYDGIISVANRFSCIEKIDLEPYHPMGIGKSEALGKEAAYKNKSFLDAKDAEEVRKHLASAVKVPVTVSGK